MLLNPLFFKQRSKQFPNLSQFLESLLLRERAKGARIGLFGGIAGAVGGLSGAAIGIWAGVFHTAFSAGALVATILGINAAVWIAIGLFWISEQRKARERPQSEIHRHAVELAKMMLQSSRLHKEVDSVAGDLLEESARNWRDIMLSFEAPFWSSQNLPAHWQAIKKQTIAVANVAMEEQLVLLRDSYQPLQSASLKDVVEDVIENYVTGVKPRRSGRFPAAYDQARAIAEKLRQTSIEIARATQDISHDAFVQSEYSSANALDMALGDIRSIKQAEEELRQNVRG